MHGTGQHGLGRPLYEECVDAATALAATGRAATDGRLLAYFPHVSRNPYQRMLYSRGFQEGFACFPLKAIDDVLELPESVRLVLHFHWLHKAFHDAADSKAAMRAVDQFLSRIRQAKDAGHATVWTVHNIMSHSAAFPEEETKLRAGVAEIADVIHIMNPDTVDLCAPHYHLPERKVITVPHPSYMGVYGDYIGRAQARFDLGLQPEDQVFLLFGALGPHKGTRQFLAVLDRLQEQLKGQARIVIAGTPGKPAFMEQIMALVAGRSDVQLFQTHVDDQGVQTFFRAADVVVCPYTRGLNSGVMATAAGFGRPVVVPSMMAGAGQGISDYIFPFEPVDMMSCHDACVAALASSGRTEIQEQLAAWALDHAPQTVSSRFFRSLDAKLADLGK